MLSLEMDEDDVGAAVVDVADDIDTTLPFQRNIPVLSLQHSVLFDPQR